ncbi:nuclear transport factor 2 family protein [Nocardia sp. NPDC057272]|uniref:nuclear transport factor 2 family protein n=1 Tax=Nocardia sp. NPDC057272 TaxID=3346079 RepID=UPI00362B3A28
MRAQVSDKATAVPYFAGLMADDSSALIRSFAGEPELHDPIRGRVKGASAFERFAHETKTWLAERSATFETVGLVLTRRRTVEETVLQLNTDGGRVELPVAVAADRDGDGRLVELRVYFSTWPLTGGHAIRPPVLQLDPDAHTDDVVGDYQRALARGDARAAANCFEPDGYFREPAGCQYIHRGHDSLRAHYETFFSNGGGVPLEHCAVADDGKACALEYNVIRWGRTNLSPQAGIAVYVRGSGGRLAAARVYDDSDPPLPHPL